MTNRLYMASNKEGFLKGSNSKGIYEWLFDKAFDYEQKYSKDLFNFNKEEMISFLSGRNTALSTLKVHLSYISSYINWAIEEGVKLSNRNITLEITNDDLNKIAKKDGLLTYETVYEIVGRKLIDRNTGELIVFDTGLPKLKNVQDKLLVYLMFIGVNGEKSHELINLRFEHVDVQNKKLKLSELNPLREDMKIDDFCIELFEKAREEQIYERYMDKRYDEEGIKKIKRTTNVKEDYDLMDSDFVFRKSAVGKKSKDNRLTYSGLLRRITSLSKYIGVNFTSKKLERSGMAYIAYGLSKAGHELMLRNVYVEKLIFERFNIYGEGAREAVLYKFRKDMQELYYNEQS